MKNSHWREEEAKKADNGLTGYVIVIISNFKAFVFTKRIIKVFFFHEFNCIGNKNCYITLAIIQLFDRPSTQAMSIRHCVDQLLCLILSCLSCLVFSECYCTKYRKRRIRLRSHMAQPKLCDFLS